VEPSATGAVRLDALLSRSGLALRAVQVVPLTVDEHVRAYLEGKVDAIVTYEPVKSQLKALGARALFSSAEVPGRIVDTLAMHRDRLTPHLRAAGELVGSHFRALGDWAQAPAACAQTMAPRLKLAASDVQAAFAELDLPDLAANRAWLRPDQPSLGLAAARLAGVMLRAGLLAQPAELDDLTDDRFLPSR
jgi:NitT/TauT family transport system substrate-binding protein